jgi:hypothetical protein
MEQPKADDPTRDARIYELTKQRDALIVALRDARLVLRVTTLDRPAPTRNAAQELIREWGELIDFVAGT